MRKSYPQRYSKGIDIESKLVYYRDMETRVMTPETKVLFDQANKARNDYRLGLIDRAACANLIKPYAELYNTKAEAIAKEFGMKAKKFSLISYLR